MIPELETLDLDADTALVVWHCTDWPDSYDAAGEALLAAIHNVAPAAVVVVLAEGQTLETLSHEKMRKLGWVKAPVGTA